MSITTKRGDKGKTDLYFGARVYKDDLRIKLLGAIDEVSSFLGFSKSLIKEERLKAVLSVIQYDLYIASGEIATGSRYLHKLKERLRPARLTWLEGLIKEYESKIKFKERCFYLSGENLLSASLGVARSVSRRSERIAVSFNRRGLLKNKFILIYLNRLSDLLFLLERRYERKKLALKKG